MIRPKRTAALVEPPGWFPTPTRAMSGLGGSYSGANPISTTSGAIRPPRRFRIRRRGSRPGTGCLGAGSRIGAMVRRPGAIRLFRRMASADAQDALRRSGTDLPVSQTPKTTPRPLDGLPGPRMAPARKRGAIGLVDDGSGGWQAGQAIRWLRRGRNPMGRAARFQEAAAISDTRWRSVLAV